MFCLGNFIGPTASGFVVEAYGFEWTTVIFFGIVLFLVLMNIFAFIHNLKYVEPGNGCEARCVCYFKPQGIAIAKKEDNETTRLIYSKKSLDLGLIPNSKKHP